jgi:lysophospholipase L1-like esterase
MPLRSNAPLVALLYRTVCVAAITCACVPACQSVDGSPAASDGRIERVFISSTELLSPPQVMRMRVYTPDRAFTLDGQDGPADVAAFFITVVCDARERLKLSVRDVMSSTALPLEPVPAPRTAASNDIDAELLSAEARSRLLAGIGVYWVEPSAAGTSQREHRVGMVLPKSELGARTIIEAYASTTSTGAPLGGDRIELVRAFFYMAVLGDSAMWGNGLPQRDKFSYLIARSLEFELGVRVVRVVQAVSGATIRTHSRDGVCTTRCGDGEVPQVFTSITTQANILPSPEIYGLILLNGCGNDVKMENILDSRDNTSLIRELVGEFCLTEMANLLIRVRARAPQAPIVVPGYFPFVSAESDLSELGTWAIANGIDLGTEEDLAAALTNFVVNSAVFHTASNEALAAAVELVSGLDATAPPIVFVNPGFRPENATFAREAWLWGLTQNIPVAQQLNISLSVFPEDPLLFERVTRCALPDVAPNLIACIYGAVGHPNRDGARAYASAIEDALRNIGLLPAGPTDASTSTE